MQSIACHVPTPYVYIYIYMCVYVCMCVCVCMCVYAYTMLTMIFMSNQDVVKLPDSRQNATTDSHSCFVQQNYRAPSGLQGPTTQGSQKTQNNPPASSPRREKKKKTPEYPESCNVLVPSRSSTSHDPTHVHLPNSLTGLLMNRNPSVGQDGTDKVCKFDDQPPSHLQGTVP